MSTLIRPITLAIIPARAGSKGLPGKAAQSVAGIPLLGRAARTACGAAAVDHVIASTDSAELAALARAHGATVPALRPPEFARDDTPIITVVENLLATWRTADGRLPEYTLLLQPTSPLTTSADVDAAFALLADPETDAVVSVCPSEVQPDWLRQLSPDGYLQSIGQLARPAHTPRQAMPPVYRLNGAIYWIRTAVLLAQRTFLPPRTRAFIMPAMRSIDVDTAWDLELARLAAARLAEAPEPVLAEV